MESIGLWYKKDENINEIAEFDIHINLWNISNNKKHQEPFIDIGIGINNYKSIDELIMLIPFKLDLSDIIDLYDYIKKPDVARLVFNEIGCETESKNKYFILKIDNNRIKLLVSIKDIENQSKGIMSIESNYFERTDNKSEQSDYEILKFNFKDIKKDEKFNNFNDLYFRFRLKTPQIKNRLFCQVDKKNWFLESGFTKTQIVDVKINKERNLPHDYCDLMSKSNYKFVCFKNIHLLVMS